MLPTLPIDAGPWAIAVSGGADSVALLRSLAPRAGLTLTVLHFNHQLRGDESAEDERFVATLAHTLGLNCVIGQKPNPARGGLPDRQKLRNENNLNNPQAHYRRDRMDFFSRTVRGRNLQGVLLAHHAGDQAETVLLRLLRGAGPLGLGGIRPDTVVAGLRVVRPLLHVRPADTRAYCRALDQRWREDSSNATDRYRRNVLRRFLATRPAVADALLAVGRASGAAHAWAESAAPTLGESFDATTLADLPDVFARLAAGRWLVDRGGRHADVSGTRCDELVRLARAGKPSRQSFPGGVLVRHTRGVIEAEASGPRKSYR